MEEQIQKTTAGKGLGIAAFVVAIVAIVISFIPCLGMYALVPGVIAIVLAIIAFTQAKKGNGKKGLIIAALIISIVGTSIAGWQLYVLTNLESEEVIKDVFQKVDTKSLEDELNDAMNQSMDSLNSSVQQMQNGLDSVK